MGVDCSIVGSESQSGTGAWSLSTRLSDFEAIEDLRPLLLGARVSMNGSHEPFLFWHSYQCSDTPLSCGSVGLSSFHSGLKVRGILGWFLDIACSYSQFLPMITVHQCFNYCAVAVRTTTVIRIVLARVSFRGPPLGDFNLSKLHSRIPPPPPPPPPRPRI